MSARFPGYERSRHRWTHMIDGERIRRTCEQLGLSEEDWTAERSWQAWKTYRDAEIAKRTGPDRFTKSVKTNIEIPDDKLTEMIEKGNWAKQVLRAGGDYSREAIDEIIGIGPLEEERRIELMEEIGTKLGGMPVPKDLTLLAQSDEWLADKKTETRSTSWKNIVYLRSRWLELDFLKVSVKDYTAATVKAFKQWALASGLSDSQKNQHCMYFRAFVTYLYKNEILDSPPRNLDDCSIEVTKKKVDPIPLGKVREVLASTKNEFHRMYALLVLNTGAQNNDIGKLRHDQITGNILTMKRGKTGDNPNVPEVQYRLWPETLELLAKFKSNHPTLFLLSSAGTPLYDSRYEGEDAKKKDLVGQQWRRAGYAMTLEEFRKVPAQQLEDHKGHKEFVAFFLGHSANGVTKGHYAPESQRRFFKACDWLRTRILGK